MLKWKDLNPLQLGLGLSGVGFALDQLSKIAIIQLLPLRGGWSHKITITPFMDFIQLRNTGVSYGLFSGLGDWGRWALVAVALVLLIVCMRWLLNAKSRLHGVGLGLILGGGAGNMLDRILYGGVVDFISLHAFGFYWFVFNLADVWLTCGIIIFFTAEIKASKNL